MSYGYKPINANNLEDILTPSDNMSINGQPLNELVEGYQQLVVTGRGLVSNELEMVPVPGRDGMVLMGDKTPVRALTVTYKLEAGDSADLRAKYNALNSVLRSYDLLDIKFKDEPGWHYFAKLSNAEMPPEDRLSIISSFELLCPDPFAYSDAKSSANIQLDYADKVLPEKIIVTGSNQEVIEISSGANTLKLIGGYSTTDRVVIEWLPKHISITKNGANNSNNLSWGSYPESFYLSDGDTVRVTGGKLESILWRDKKR